MNCLQVQWSFSPKVKVTATLGAWVEFRNVSSARLSKLTSGNFLSNDDDKGGEKGWPHHLGLRPLLFLNSGLGSFTSHKNRSVEVLWDGTYGFSSLSEKTRKSNHLQMSLQRQHFLLSYLKTLIVCPAGVWTPRPSAQQTGALPTKLTRRLYATEPPIACALGTHLENRSVFILDPPLPKATFTQ